MSHIHDLIPDVYKLLKTTGWFTDEIKDMIGREAGRRLQAQFNYERKPALSLSQMGDKCPCALWHSIHHPELAEPLPPWAMFKYSYGHMIEALAITLARVAGHTVEGEQDELNVDGIVGHRDCVIDGCLVDVKSASSFSLGKFKDGSIKSDDPFGYLAQLDGYLVGSAEDPLVQVKDKAYNWVIDKTLGHMVLYEHEIRPEFIRQRIKEYKRVIAGTIPPACTCETRPSGKSGNVELGTVASYSAYKHQCFPNLRTFLYASGPVYLTRVVRKPDVVEVDKNGKSVYN